MLAGTIVWQLHGMTRSRTHGCTVNAFANLRAFYELAKNWHTAFRQKALRNQAGGSLDDIKCDSLSLHVAHEPQHCVLEQPLVVAERMLLRPAKQTRFSIGNKGFLLHISRQADRPSQLTALLLLPAAGKVLP